jgi:hypothetical protein
LKKCPFCAEQIQDDAVKCRYCGEFLDGRQTSSKTVAVPWSYEYRSKRQLFGMPLVHIAQGIDPETGMPRIARGFIAIGNIAFGVIAIGGFSFGLLTLGGIALGGLVFGGISIGIIAVGGMAVSLFLSLGGLAISARYAIGGLGIAPHVIDSVRVDPDFVGKLERLWPGVSRSFGRH